LQNSRIEALARMLEARPDDVRARFGLALEMERLQRWDEVVEHLGRYLAATEDEGNAHGRLARALRRLGRDDEAREAYRSGIAAATRHGHPTLAMDLEAELDEME
jgi:thioredoxin-like negative regulator of GroEL